MQSMREIKRKQQDLRQQQQWRAGQHQFLITSACLCEKNDIINAVHISVSKPNKKVKGNFLKWCVKDEV